MLEREGGLSGRVTSTTTAAAKTLDYRVGTSLSLSLHLREAYFKPTVAASKKDALKPSRLLPLTMPIAHVTSFRSTFPRHSYCQLHHS
jgi:hypothetical protein